jgi:3-methyladenine DNA glycosylase AlkD
MDKDKTVLYQMARSDSLWQRRIAVVSTFFFIRQNRFQETLQIAKLLLFDTEDLIHKAVGWMLREIGKRDLAVEENFLEAHYHQMPRTMLRYAIEKFPEERRQQYLKNRV